MFVGREKELGFLEQRYKSNKFEFIPIYGRRRVGKTTLINEFVRDKRVIYFSAMETSWESNLAGFSQSIMEAKGQSADAVFASFEAALDEVYRMSEQDRLIFVIDEYPYLAQAYPAISSLLQIKIDHKYLNSQLFIILSGSSMSFMEEQVLGYKSPIYGRRTGQIKLNPFGYFDTKKFFKSFTDQEMAVIYGLTGGVPKYILEFSEAKTLAENIKDSFLNPKALLFEEPGNLLKQELREPAAYNAVIEALANGYTRTSDIAVKVGVSQPLCVNYLKVLCSLGIVKKEAPFGMAVSKKPLYSLADNMFRFWYRFIPRNLSIIQQYKTDLAYRIVASQLDSYMGFVFESIAKEFMFALDGTEQLPFVFSDLGRWWGNDKFKRQETEVDIVASDYEHKQLILGECKWTNSLVGEKVLQDLLEQGRLFTADKKYYVLFAKNGFTDPCRQQAAQAGNVLLFDFEQMNRLI